MQFEIPPAARDATEEIETDRSKFRERMAGKVRLREEAEPGDSTGSWELMPMRLAYGGKAEIRDYLGEHIA